MKITLQKNDTVVTIEASVETLDDVRDQLLIPACIAMGFHADSVNYTLDPDYERDPE
jgi:hypothetical protein